MHADAFAEVGQTHVGKPDMAAHREVRAIQLQNQAGLMDGLVLVLHRVGQRSHVGLGGFIVMIGQEARDDAR